MYVPGPYTVKANVHGKGFVISSPGGAVAKVPLSFNWSPEEKAAVAHLFAKAPDMEALLRRTMDHLARHLQAVGGPHAAPQSAELLADIAVLIGDTGDLR